MHIREVRPVRHPGRIRRARECRERRDLVVGQHADQLDYIPFVSREATETGIQTRIPAAIEDGRLEAHAGLPLTAETSQVMICGNPAMVRDTQAILEKRGLKKNRRREPGHITTEQYWKE